MTIDDTYFQSFYQEYIGQKKKRVNYIVLMYNINP